MHHEPAAVPTAQRVMQRRGAFESVQVKNTSTPIAAEHSFGLLRSGFHAGGNDENVILQLLARSEQDAILLGFHVIDLRPQVINAARNKAALRLNHISRRVNPERHKEKARLIVVGRSLINNRDLAFPRLQSLLQTIGHNRAGCAGAENEERFLRWHR
jgi:hypothetical protein